MASCVLFIFCRLFYYFQYIIGRTVQTIAYLGKNGKVNAGYLVLAVIIELSPLQTAFFTDKVFTFLFFLQQTLQINLNMHTIPAFPHKYIPGCIEI